MEITEEEKVAMISWLEAELQDYYFSISQQRANLLNALFVKLTGKNHETWDRRGGKYGK